MITNLADLIAQAESSNNPYAVRYESAHMPATQFVVEMTKAASCSLRTAQQLCSMSWGLYQIMGDELMAQGLKCSPIEFCGNPHLQYVLFQSVLHEKELINYTLADVLNDDQSRINFAAKYNGPGQPEVYAQYLLDVYKKTTP